MMSVSNARQSWCCQHQPVAVHQHAMICEVRRRSGRSMRAHRLHLPLGCRGAGPHTTTNWQVRRSTGPVRIIRPVISWATSCGQLQGPGAEAPKPVLWIPKKLDKKGLELEPCVSCSTRAADTGVTVTYCVTRAFDRNMESLHSARREHRKRNKRTCFRNSARCAKWILQSRLCERSQNMAHTNGE